jgi:uncharacterized protein (TIGR00255 family)
MVTSMTGFGRAEHNDSQGRLVVELRSVNHRFLQLDCHLPVGQGWVEPHLRRLCEERLSRGKVTLRLVQYDYGQPPQLHINRQGVTQIMNFARDLQDELGRPVPCSLEGVLALPGMLQAETTGDDQDTAWERLGPVVDKALAAFIASRRDEGARLASDLRERLSSLRTAVTAIKAREPEFRQAFIQRFTTRIRELAGQAGIDEQRLASEVVIWTDRSDISEELTRLDSHLVQFDKLLSGDGPLGRKLDFLLQEINREANTVNSKIGDLPIIQQVLEIKSELEKVREQLQNIE